MVEFVIGVDGGGSGTRAWVARPSGPVLGRGDAGPSALGQGIGQAWQNIEHAVRAAFDDADVAWPGWPRCGAVCALSGVSNPAWRDAFLAADRGLALLDAETDAFAMLVGAHGGRPGAIVAAGTGSVGEVLRPDGTRTMVGGWGFPIGDEGSGAWLGLQAVRHAQAVLDGRERGAALAQHVFARCGSHRDALQAWCDTAGQFAYAQLARAVFEYEAVDPRAAALLREAVSALECIAHALDPQGALPVAFAGSVAHRLAPRVAPALRARRVEPAEGPAAGALALARRLVQEELMSAN